jgi:hypothetical protein
MTKTSATSRLSRYSRSATRVRRGLLNGAVGPGIIAMPNPGSLAIGEPQQSYDSKSRYLIFAALESNSKTSVRTKSHRTYDTWRNG